MRRIAPLVDSVLITGAGSFASSFIKRLLNDSEYERVCVFSRGELNQMKLREKFDNDERLRFFLGDICSKDRLRIAMRGIKDVVHSAALKDIAACHYNSTECVRINIGGTSNVIEAAAEAGVERMVTLSTDKAANPVSIYGTSKLAAEQITLAANHTYGEYGPRFTASRYGNCTGSARSVVPRWRAALATGGEIFLTDPRCTRFHMTQQEAVQLVLDALDHGPLDRPLIPVLPGYRLADLAEAMGIEDPTIIGLPDYEKLNETMDGNNYSHFGKMLSVEELREILKSV